MKAKRLTALALAALMAASTTSVALASERVDADLDFANDGYYKYNSDTNRLESAKRDEFQPGDDVYLRLVEDSSDTFTNKKTYNAYADWTIGDSWVKDIDVVYRKGDISSVTGYDVTYSFKGDTITTTSASNDKAAFIKAQQDAVKSDNKYVKAYIGDNYTSVEGYIYNGKIYPTFNDAITNGAGVSIFTQTTWSYSDKSSTTSLEDLMSQLSATKVSASGYKYSNKYFADAQTLLTDSQGLNISSAQVKDAASATGVWITEADIDTKGYGEYKTTNNTDSLTEANSSSLSGQICLFTGTDNKTYWAKIDKLEAALSEHRGVEVVHATDGDYYISGTKEYIAVSAVGKTEKTLYTDITGLNTTEITDVTQKYTGLKDEKTSAFIAGKNAVVSASGSSVEQNIEDTAIAAIKAELAGINPTFTPKTTASAQYEYWVKITTKDSATTKDIDIVGSVWVGTSKSSAKKEKGGSEDKFRADFTLTNSDPGNDDYDEATDYVSIEPGERAVVSFADDASDEFEVEFGDDAYFVFNARGQGKLNLAYNTKYNKDFAYDYDDANIDFINFEGEPTTNRTGTLYIYADEDSYIYEVTSKGAKKINGAYYDDDEGAWVIRTRSLTSYAISDKKLKTVDQMNNGSSSSSGSNSGSNSGSGSNNGKPNPDTGR